MESAVSLAIDPALHFFPRVERWGDPDWRSPFGSVPSGCLELDAALGTCGFPRNHLVEVLGAPGTGKSTLALEAIAALQGLGGAALLLDLERSWHEPHARALGIEPDRLIVAQPQHAGEAAAMAAQVIGSGLIDLVVIDSLTAWLPEVEWGSSMEADFSLVQSRAAGEALQRLMPLIRLKHVAVLVINQLRRSLEEGSPERTAGWPHMQHFTAQRVRLSQREAVQPSPTMTGVDVGFTVIKNWFRYPRGSGSFSIWFGEGLRRPQSLLRWATRMDLVNHSGAGYSCAGAHLGADSEDALEMLVHDCRLLARVEEQIRAHCFLKSLSIAPAKVAADGLWQAPVERWEHRFHG